MGDVSFERLSFQEAISEPRLLKAHWDTLSLPQQVTLKAFNGLDLNAEERIAWAMLQERGMYDSLGYPIGVPQDVSYTPYANYHELWCLFGRRSGKTSSVAATQIVYESLLGGHTRFVAKKQDCIVFVVGAKLERIIADCFPFIRNVLNTSPLLNKMIKEDLATRISFKNGVTISPAAPRGAAIRGAACPVAYSDEVGAWATETEAAHPDLEFERAISKSMAQFPNYCRFGTSTPLIREGILWRAHQAGTLGWKLPVEEREAFKAVLVCHAPTPYMVEGLEIMAGTPLISRTWFVQEYNRDPEAYRREILAEFIDQKTAFISEDLLASATDTGVVERAPEPRFVYVGALDPAFRRDNFTLSIGHHDPERGLVQDCVRVWTPTPEQKVNPSDVLDEIVPLAKAYRLRHLTSDQAQLESLQQLFLQRGLALVGKDFTTKSKAKIFGSMITLLRQGRLKLLDLPELLQELRNLQRIVTGGGYVRIGAPVGQHDDMATVTAMMCAAALWLLPRTPEDTSGEDKATKEPSLFERCMATVKRKQEATAEDD